jgi:hypothetical protein
MSAVTGAKIGRGCPNRAIAAAQASAVASAAWTNHRTLVLRRWTTIRGRDCSAASSSSAIPRSRTCATLCSLRISGIARP